MERINAIEALKIKNVVFIGAGFVGGPTATVLASQIKDIDVAVVDIDEARIEAWNSDTLPVFEPGLEELVILNRANAYPSQQKAPLSSSEADSPLIGTRSLDRDTNEPRRNLWFSTNIDRFMKQADMIFLCIDTPQRRDNTEYEGTPDFTDLRKAVDRIGKVVVKNFILVEKCTVPPGTTLLIRKILKKSIKTDIQFEILSNPEFLAEGSAIKCIKDPDRVLIGAADTIDGAYASAKLVDLYKHWIPRSKIIASDAWSAELSKLSTNALLAQRVSSINSLSMMCERMGGDIREIAKVVQSDPRIGNQMLSASAGFGGSCFPKDVAQLVYLASSLGLHEVAEYWKAVLKVNVLRKTTFADRICDAIEQRRMCLRDVAVLGFAFKGGSNDVRNSAAINITKRMLEICNVRVYDPLVSEDDINACLGHDAHARLKTKASTVEVCSDAYTACKGASVVVVLTDWDGFKFEASSPQETGQAQMRSPAKYSDPNSSPHFTLANKCHNSVQDRHRWWKQIAEAMEEPKLLFDGRNVVEDSIAKLGFIVERIGKGKWESEATTLNRLHGL